MKLPIHYLILFCCLLAMLPLMPGTAQSQSLTAITESDIHAMLNATDRATRKGNVADMIAPLASDIKIKMSILNPGSDKEQEGTLTKEQFEFNARTNLRRRLAYKLERKNTQIKIYNEQLAKVTSEVYEVFKMREGTLRASSSEVLYVTLRDGKLVITAAEVSMRVY